MANLHESSMSACYIRLPFVFEIGLNQIHVIIDKTASLQCRCNSRSSGKISMPQAAAAW